MLGEDDGKLERNGEALPRRLGSEEGRIGGDDLVRPGLVRHRFVSSFAGSLPATALILTCARRGPFRKPRRIRKAPFRKAQP